MIFEKFGSHEVSQFSIFKIPNPFQVSYDLKPLFLKKDMFFSGSQLSKALPGEGVSRSMFALYGSLWSKVGTPRASPLLGFLGTMLQWLQVWGPGGLGELSRLRFLENTSFTARNQVVCFMMNEWGGQRPERWTAPNVVRWSWTLLWRKMCVLVAPSTWFQPFGSQLVTRKTAPHEGYEILSRWVEKFHFRDSLIGQEIRCWNCKFQGSKNTQTVGRFKGLFLKWVVSALNFQCEAN